MVSFPQVSQPKLCKHLSSPTICAYLTHLIPLDLITRTILGEEYRSLNSSLRNFLHSPLSSPLLGPISSRCHQMQIRFKKFWSGEILRLTIKAMWQFNYNNIKICFLPRKFHSFMKAFVIAFCRYSSAGITVRSENNKDRLWAERSSANLSVAIIKPLPMP